MLHNSYFKCIFMQVGSIFQLLTNFIQFTKKFVIEIKQKLKIYISLIFAKCQPRNPLTYSVRSLLSRFFEVTRSASEWRNR